VEETVVMTEQFQGKMHRSDITSGSILDATPISLIIEPGLQLRTKNRHSKTKSKFLYFDVADYHAAQVRYHNQTRSEYAHILTSVPVFGFIPTKLMEWIFEAGEILHFQAGSVVMSDDERAHPCMYVVLEGFGKVHRQLPFVRDETPGTLSKLTKLSELMGPPPGHKVLVKHMAVGELGQGHLFPRFKFTHDTSLKSFHDWAKWSPEKHKVISQHQKQCSSEEADTLLSGHDLRVVANFPLTVLRIIKHDLLSILDVGTVSRLFHVPENDSLLEVPLSVLQDKLIPKST
jgi:hypothetical protein